MKTVVDRSPLAVAEASRDFGRLISGRAEGVITARTPDEVVEAIREANAEGFTLTPAGTRSSCGGQSLSAGGLALDMKAMAGVGPVDADALTVECESGATLRSIADATLRHGLLPNVLSFNLDITIGGVLSAGGFGANCHRYAPMVANVEALDVVTGAGQRVRCSRTHEPALFHAVLGGLGRCAVILGATLRLRRVKSRVRMWSLIHHRHQDWFDDQENLSRSERCDYLQGFFWAGPNVLRPTTSGFVPEQQWFFGSQVGVEYDGQAPADDSIFGGIKPSGVLTVDDADTSQYIDLYRDRFVQMRRTDAWRRRHPWIDCLLSPAVLREILPQVLAKLPRSVGDGHRLAWFPTRNLPGLFSVPAGDWAVAFAVLPTSIDESVYEETLVALDEVRRLLWRHGGKAYLVGWFGPMDDAAWRRHYGDRYDTWVAAKTTYDPRGILHSMAFTG
jgi:cytokinin dehydrogenase